MHSLRLLAIATLMLSTLSACGGGGAKVKNETHSTTIGQELMDLDEAYQRGLISEKEYKKTRKHILSQ